MEITTQWIKPTPVIGGQDHLGTQAPAESIYTSLLPGITNVTGRARYYSFYPWFLWRFEARFPTSTPTQLETMLRRAECLFALIGIRHGASLGERDDRHGATMVGREVLVPALNSLAPDGKLALSKYAVRDDESKDQYFANPLGGLAQYYFGSLRDLGILGGDLRTKDVRYTPERGLPLARAFAAADPANRFFDLIEADEVTLSDLDGLAALCPCGLLRNQPECAALVDLLIDPEGKLGDESRPRQSTLSLLLDLAARRDRSSSRALEDELRAASYSGALSTGAPWELPAALARARQTWAVYQRNELLSIAFQGLFWAALESSGRVRFVDTADLVSSFLMATVAKGVPEQLLHQSFEATVARKKAELPPLSDWTSPGHEMSTAGRLFEAVSAKRHAVVVGEAVAMLLALVARDDGTDPYASCSFGVGYLDRYPLNLRSLMRRARGELGAMTSRDAIGSLAAWAIEVHYRVALQKLAVNPPRDTFKIRPLEGELRIVGDTPRPVYTAPRTHRAVVILHDLGLLQTRADGAGSVPSAQGLKVLEVLRG